MVLSTFFLLVALGGAAGFLAGLLGVGGGIVLVPGLYYVLTSLGYGPEHTMHVAVGTSLAIIVPTGLSSVLAHRRRGAVRFDLAAMIGPGIVIGTGLGTLIADRLSGQALMGVFSCALIFLSGIMLADPARFKLGDVLPRQPWTALAGAVIGGLSSLIGIGGATVSVPFMSLYGVPIRQAVGTASLLGLVIAVPSMAGFMYIGQRHQGLPPYSIGYVNLAAWAVIVPLSVLAAPLGARLAHRIDVALLRRIFAVFIALVAIKMLAGLLL